MASEGETIGQDEIVRDCEECGNGMLDVYLENGLCSDCRTD
ncbi:hypothetical protein [Halococcus agarilyticus]|nr:hypothetical protein [Halococcus agarilyticus]